MMNATTSNFPPGIAYMEGKYMPMEEAKISVLDRGFLRSDATYDVVHVWKGRFFASISTSSVSSPVLKSYAWSCRSAESDLKEF